MYTSSHKEIHMSKNVHLLLIDPQNDFCDPKGTLYVPGAEKDTLRLVSLLDEITPDAIHITMDTKNKGFNSKLVHGGGFKDKLHSAVTPIYQTSTFSFEDAEKF